MYKFSPKKAWISLGIILAAFAIIVVYGLFFAESIGENKMAHVSPETFKTYQSTKGILAIHTWENSQGVKVYFVEAPNLPMMDIRMVFDAGNARNTLGMPLAYFANTLLNQGTLTTDADDIATQFEMVGAQYGAGTYRDMAFVSLRTLTNEKYLNKSVKLFAEVITNPAYDEKALKREKQTALAMLKYQAQTPDIIAERVFYETIYENKPYGFWELGDEKSIKKIKSNDLLRFHKNYYVQKNAIIAMVGDVSLAKANAISEELTAALPIGEKAPPLNTVDTTRKLNSKQVKFESSQTHIMYGMPVLTRHDDDYFALVVGNHILGGNAQNNRLFDTIRGQYGLAYSAYSHFIPMQTAGPFMMVCQTKTEEGMRVKKMLQQMLTDFIENGPTEVELQQAKLNIIGGYPIQFDSNRSIVGQLAVMGFYDLPLDYFNQYSARVEDVTIETIQDAFKRRVIPEQMAVVMVGESK